jgi:hypothetical protein
LYGTTLSAVKTETTRALQTLRDACAADVNAVVAASMAASDAAVRRARVDAAREAEERKRELGNERTLGILLTRFTAREGVRAFNRWRAVAALQKRRAWQMSRTIAMLRHRSVARAMATWRERVAAAAATKRENARTRAAEDHGAFLAKRVEQARSHFFTLVPIRPRWRGERRSLLRTLSSGASLRPPPLAAFNPDTPRRLSTPLLTPLNSTPTFVASHGPSTLSTPRRSRR